jgi:hypothetical protein
MPTRVVIDDADRDLAMKEGLSSARGDEFIEQNGEQVAKNPLHPVSSYGSQHFELVSMDPGAQDRICEPASMTRPFDSFSYPGSTGEGIHQGREAGQEYPHKSPLYSGDSGKVSSELRQHEGGNHMEERVSPRTIDRDEFRMSKNDQV